VLSGAVISISSVDEVPSLYFLSLDQLCLVISCRETEDLELAQVHTWILDQSINTILSFLADN